MICASVSEILYPGGTFGENLCIVCTDLLLAYAPAVNLQYLLTNLIYNTDKRQVAAHVRPGRGLNPFPDTDIIISKIINNNS